MTYLILALVGLAIGPVLFTLLHRSEKPQLAVDGFVLTAVVGLVALHVMPMAIEVAGLWALAAALFGLLLPLAAERIRALSHEASHGVVLAIAFAGLLLHASLDGVGLSGSDGLGLAVVVHRIPVGLGVWWLVRPQFGRRWATAVLLALGVATVAGWSLQTAVIEPGGIVWVQVVQALVAGSLLHVLLHQSVGLHNHAPIGGRWRIPGTIGALLGIALVGWVPDAHEHMIGEQLLDIVLVASPYLLGAIALAVGIGRKQPWRQLNWVAPWSVGIVVIGALVTHIHTEPSVLSSASAVAYGAVVLLSLLRQGPRDFVLRVLPLDILSSAHQHDHHDHDHSHHHVHHVTESGNA